ncbi:hypothetical protein [Streptomyces sp. NPDC059909]|uniref:hypothetical protein n=1 Tax=Streptomyces sp. NPDC059909 TaxID=3346998 RepID=UPI003666DED3
MQVMRRTLFVASTALATVMLAAGGGAGADIGDRVPEAADTAGAAVVRVPVAEADVAHHGHASLWGGRIVVWLESDNHGPAQLADATVRLSFSAPVTVTGGGQLPPACLWGGDRVILCRTGELRAGGTGGGIALDLLIPGNPPEIIVGITTVWSDGAVDRNHANDEHTVLVPATGDGYVF